MSVCVCVCLGCKSMITCFWFAVDVGLIRTVLFSFLRIHTHNICLPLGVVCKSDHGVECTPSLLEEISIPCPSDLSLFKKTQSFHVFSLFKPPPPSHPPNLHSHFSECGNLSCDTAEIRLGNSVRIVLDMVLVAPI